MRKLLIALAILLLATPAFAAEDTSTLLKRQTQELLDAVSDGDAAVWEKYLDADLAYSDEGGGLTNKKETVGQIRPLPKGISGTITVINWVAHAHGDTIVTTFDSDEHEDFHGQKIHALYRNTGVWQKEPDGWKLIAMHTLAARQDPPAVTLPTATLDDYVGRYEIGPDYFYVITRNGDELMGGTEGGKPAPLKAELRDVLFAPGQPRSRKIVVRDAQGHVTGLLSRREERDIVFTKIK